MDKQKRNLAFYKTDGSPWTPEEAQAICRYCGDRFEELGSVPNKKYFYDGQYSKGSFMYSWSIQSEKKLAKCKKIAYDDVFNLDNEVRQINIHDSLISSYEQVHRDHYPKLQLNYYQNETLKQAMKQLQKTQQKGRIMKDENNISIDINIDGKVHKLCTDKPIKEKTDLELASKYVTIWYDNFGNEVDKSTDTPKQATKALQDPKRIGWTFISYKHTIARTTSIPVVDC